MKNHPVVEAALKSAYNIYARPRLTIEWNMNRHYSATADNVAPEEDFGYDPDLFPIESITSGNRPTKGVQKALVGQSTVARNTPDRQSIRFYAASSESLYKYWISPVKTDGSGTFPRYNAAIVSEYEAGETATPDGGSMVRPYITYENNVYANKIVIKTENSYATPATYDIQVYNHNGGTWTTIPRAEAAAGMNLSTGQITVWWDGTGWTAAKPVGVLERTLVGGVRFVVETMGPGRDLNGDITVRRDTDKSAPVATTGANSFLSLIEIAACLEADLTNKLIAVDDTFDFSEKSLIYPFGTITANVANITLSNLYSDAEVNPASNNYDHKTGLWAENNADSPFHGLAEKNARVNLEYVYEIDGTEYPVQQLSMYTEDWSIPSDDQVTVELRDYSKFFDEVKPLPTYWQDFSVAEIIWRLCDQLGFVDYVVEVDEIESLPEIRHWWTDGTKTMWEIINELSVATQTAVYFDEYGRLRIRSRRMAFDSAAEPVWTLRGETLDENNLADITSIDQSGVAQTNHVTVKYYNSDFFKDPNKFTRKMERVWEPEGTLGVNASILVETMTNSAEWITINPKDAELWQYSGLAQIQGEIIRYEGKQYKWFVKGEEKPRFSLITSHEEYKDKINKSDPARRDLNTYTGKLKIVERGVGNTEQKWHRVEAEGYSVRKIVNGTRTVNSNGFHHQGKKSIVSLSLDTSVDRKANDLLIATRGQENDTTFWHYGTRLRFKSTSREHQRAGIVINNQGSNEDGYYIDIQASKKTNDETRNEIVVNARKNGEDKLLGKGKGLEITEDRPWIDLDIRVFNNNGTHKIWVGVNGEWRLEEVIPDARNVTLNGRFGIFVRGDTEAEFEYLYALKDQPYEPADGASWWDGVEGGYLSQRWDEEWVYTKTKKKKKNRRKIRRKSKRFMDEFGPWVHEVRELNIKFDPSPVQYSLITFSSPGAAVTEYTSGPFGASFFIANIARRNVTVHGEAGNICVINGRTIEVKDAQEIIQKNDAQISLSGKIETEIDSPWIQSEDSANKIANWIVEHWSKGADELSVTIFGNTLIEIGDVVGVAYSERHMTPETHKYFVVSTATDFSNGIETTLSLRRVT